MKKLIAAALATTALTGAALAQSADVTEFRIGILGGENAQDRMNSYECLRGYTEERLGVPAKLFAPADYNGVIQGLLGGTLDMAWLGFIFMAMTFVVFVLYGQMASLVRGRVLSSPTIMKWLRRSFAAAFAALGLRLALSAR